MSWAARRRFFVLLIVGAAVAAFAAIIFIATFYKTPTCTDGAQNQDETGVDCGGSCPYLCTAAEQPPTILFTKVLRNAAGRTDVVALVENTNAAAARGVPYRLTLYGAARELVKELDGTIDLPPNTRVPVYVPGAAPAETSVTQAFLEIPASVPRWYAAPARSNPELVVVRTTLGGTASAPRADMLLLNTGARALSDVRIVVLVRDDRGDVIEASQTIVPRIPAGEQETAVCTWQSAFKSDSVSLEAVPILPLPAP